MTQIQEEIFKCGLSGDLETLKKLLLESEAITEDPQDLFGKKDEVGRNVLLNASMLGRSVIVQELVGYGAQVNQQTGSGYSSLHLAACWGHLDTVRTLLELGADTQAKTLKGEKPADLARKYSKTDCADCLIIAEGKQDFVSYVDFIKNTMADSERSLTKGEKNICTRMISEKSDWIQTVRNPTAADFTAQRKDMEDALQPVLSKLSAQSDEKPVRA